MRKLQSQFWNAGLIRFIPVAACCFSFLCTVSAQTNTSSLSTAPKSVFEDPTSRPGLTDPFFPKTRRFVPVVAAPAPVPAPAAPTTQVGELRLKGISGGAGNRLALINNQTLAV